MEPYEHDHEHDGYEHQKGDHTYMPGSDVRLSRLSHLLAYHASHKPDLEQCEFTGVLGNAEDAEVHIGTPVFTDRSWFPRCAESAGGDDAA